MEGFARSASRASRASSAPHVKVTSSPLSQLSLYHTSDSLFNIKDRCLRYLRSFCSRTVTSVHQTTRSLGLPPTPTSFSLRLVKFQYVSCLDLHRYSSGFTVPHRQVVAGNLWCRLRCLFSSECRIVPAGT